MSDDEMDDIYNMFKKHHNFLIKNLYYLPPIDIINTFCCIDRLIQEKDEIIQENTDLYTLSLISNKIFGDIQIEFSREVYKLVNSLDSEEEDKIPKIKITIIEDFYEAAKIKNWEELRVKYNERRTHTYLSFLNLKLYSKIENNPFKIDNIDHLFIEKN